jgi:hypothetical protein
MSIETFIADSGQECAVEVDSTADQPAQTAMGGADRSEGNWVTVADAVPCLVDLKKTDVNYDRNNQRVYLTTATIYFAEDPVLGGLSIRHRIRIVNTGTSGPRIAGPWAIRGIMDPIPAGDHLEVLCQRTGLP